MVSVVIYCDQCGDKVKAGDTIYNVGDAVNIVIYCASCYGRG